VISGPMKITRKFELNAHSRYANCLVVSISISGKMIDPGSCRSLEIPARRSG
jgi:hypothetical protein